MNEGPVIECHACLLGVDVYGDREWLDWPCETAKLVYTPDEVAAMLGKP